MTAEAERVPLCCWERADVARMERDAASAGGRGSGTIAGVTGMRQRQAERYASQVIGVLAEDLPTFVDDEVARDVVRRVLRNRAVKGDGGTDGAFEVIVDSPISATWRLRASSGGRVHLADHGYFPNEDRRALETRINARLATL